MSFLSVQKGIGLVTPGPQISERDRMYGRGTMDMKAGIAVMIYAVKAIQQAGIKLAGDVIVQTVTDEEAGGNGTLACIERGYLGDGCLIPETFGQSILLGSGGIIWLRTVVAGIPAHPMAGLQRTNAFDNALYLIEGLRKLEENECCPSSQLSTFASSHQFYCWQNGCR